MKKALLILSALGIGVVQQSGAAVVVMTSDTLITPSKSNISVPANYATIKNRYSSSNGSVFVSSNDEIRKALDNLSAHAKQKEYQLSSLTSRLSYDRSINTDDFDDIKKWAEQGSSEFQYKLGMIYYEGKNIRQDITLARKMFQKSASQGNIQGQGMLGYFYESGLGGLKRNRATAKEWYGKTCDKGSSYGCSEYKRLNERGY